MWIKDSAGRYVLANRAMAEFVGLATPDALEGLTDFDLFDPEVAQNYWAVEQEILRTGQPLDSEGAAVDAAGRERWLLSAKVPLKDANGEVVGLVGLSRDITERVEMEKAHEELEERLSQAQRLAAVGRLAGGVAHDYNNMLQVILGNAELALAEVSEGDPLYESLSEIHQAGKRSAHLTRQLLAFARRQTIMPQVVDLNEIVSGTLGMLRRLVGEDIRLTWAPGAELGPVKMDPGQIDQILVNLVTNARDAINGVGEVIIETDNAEVDAAYADAHPGAQPGSYVLLAVSDNGAGMDAETLAHIFEPFFTTKAVGEGTGLGLATVYGIVRQNNGIINVYSELGQGSTFRIYLPRHTEAAAEAEAAPTTPELARGTGAVLLVEDEEAVRLLQERNLERLGYTVLAAATPTEALALSAKYDGDIALLITDVVMPQMNGRELAERLQAQRPGLRSLYMSGYTANVVAQRGVLEEGISFIQKPFTLAQLASKVREALEK